MNGNEQVIQEINLDTFARGMVSTGRARAVPAGALRVLTGLLIDADGAARHRGGQATLFTSLAAVVQGFTRWSNASKQRVVYATAGDVREHDEGAGTSSSIGSCHASNLISLASFSSGGGDKLFLADGSGNLKAWNGTGNIYDVGIAAPGTAPTLADGGAGLLDSSIDGYVAYRYYITYAAADGTESNPSPVSAELDVTLKQITLSSIPTSADTRVTKRHIYRDGGSIAVPRRVGTINDNTTTTYTDNLSDVRVGTTQLSFNNARPPAGLSMLLSLKGRLFGAGNSARPYSLYCSSLGLPEYWPEEPETLETDGGIIDPTDPEFDDPITCLGQVGSYGVIGHRRTLYILDGSDFLTFARKKIADIGIAGPRAGANCAGPYWFLGSDGMVYELATGEPQRVGLQVEDTLRAVSASRRAGACCAYHDQRFILCIPNTTGSAPLVLVYDFRQSAWSDQSHISFAFTQFWSGVGATGNEDLLAATQQGYATPAGTAYRGIVKVFTTDAADVSFTLTTGDMDAGEPVVQKKIRSVTIYGSLTISTGQTATVTLSAGDGTSFTSASFTLANSVNGIILKTRAPATLVGNLLRCSITGIASACRIEHIVIEYVPLRKASS